jgi:hypothetical protein
MERCWLRQDSKKRSLNCNKEQMKEKYYNGGRNKRKNPKDDYKGTQCRICHYCSI